ncbi:MAG: DUF4198 domain-containing protein [Bacteroidota bacterium]
MKKTFVLLLALVLFSSHDMFLKLDTYFLPANSSAQIKLYNGTFDRSDNTIARDRMLDASLVGNGERSEVREAQWSEKDSMTILSFETGAEGTWVAGVSTRPRDFEMAAADFNQYLEHDGVLDMLNWRTANEALEEDAVERYSKHVKAIFQVGDQRSDDWQTVLGYPIELVPLANPYELEVKDVLQLQLLWQGEPLGNQLIYADVTSPTHGHSHDHDYSDDHAHEHSAGGDHSHAGDEGHSHSHEAAHDHAHGDDHGHGHAHGADSHSHSHESKVEEEDHSHANEMLFRTDANGRFSLPISTEGIWYLRTIYLTHSDEPGLTHESNWTTLTFEVGHSHGEGTHTHADGTEHEHHHEDELGVPSYVFWLGSLALIGVLFFWFNRKQG